MPTPALLPCPLCGGKPIVFTEDLSEVYGYAKRVSIECRSCGVRLSRMGDTSKPGYADNSKVKSEAHAAWNQRTHKE